MEKDPYFKKSIFVVVSSHKGVNIYIYIDHEMFGKNGHIFLEYSFFEPSSNHSKMGPYEFFSQ